MRSLGHVFIAILIAGQTLAQQPQFVPPKLKGDRSVAGQNPITPSDDPAALYENRHEAAIAALKEANRYAALGRSGSDRAINLLLIAAKREPSFGKPVYNLGVLCAQGDRWQDAINFYQEAQQVDPNPEMVKLAADELERVGLIFSLESSSEGRRRRQFDRDFMEALQKKEAPLALDAVNRLSKSDPGNWEAFALAGMLQAELGHNGDSAKALESAARLAPDARRKALLSAMDIAKREEQYEGLVQNADQNWEKQNYEAAAKLYADAWEINPGRIAVAMQSATGFLMADQVPLAVQVLARIRQTGPAEYSQKATLMLNELAAISEAAKTAASLDRSSSAEPPAPEVAGRIRDLVGDLSSREMKLVIKPAPKLLEDNTSFIKIPDAEIQHSESANLSFESPFDRYKNNKNPAPPASTTDGAPAPALPVLPDQQPSVPPEAPGPSGSPGRPPKLNPRADLAPSGVNSSNSLQASAGNVTIISQPSGAMVFVDDSSQLTCRTPCEIPLAADRHTLKSTVSGRRDILRIFEVVKGGNSPMELSFEAKQGTVLVQSDPAGARIYLNGAQTARITPDSLVLGEGQYEIGVEAGGSVATKPVTVKDGDLLRLSF